MLTIIISAVAVGIVIGIIIGIQQDSFGEGIGGFFLGALIGALVSFMVLLASSCHVANPEDCSANAATYDLMPYTIESKDYYTYMSNSDNGIFSNIQYLDEDGAPQSLKLSSNTEYYYGISKEPSIEIISYKTEGNLWHFAPTPPTTQYKIYLPDKSLIYQGIN